MADFGINVDPGEVGLDAQRLRRIDTHSAGTSTTGGSRAGR